MQKLCCLVLATQSRVDPVACPNCEPTQRFFAAHWRVNVLVVKILRNFFKIGVFMFLAAQIGDLFTGGGSNRDSLMGRTSNREKHLKKFSNFFVLSALATYPDNLNQSQKSCVLRK